MINLFGKEIPCKMEELTLEQFQKISAIHNSDEYDTLEKHCKVFEYLGITEDEMDVDFDLFLENVRLFNKDNYTKKDPVEEIIKRTSNILNFIKKIIKIFFFFEKAADKINNYLSKITI